MWAKGHARERSRLYCLRCFVTLPAPATGVTRCGRCGFVNRPTDRRTYWNLRPRIRLVEVLLKAGIAALAGGLMVLLALGRVHMGLGAGWVVASPVFLGVLLWQTASTLTRHGSLWRPSVAWIALLLLFCVVPWLLYAQRRAEPWFPEIPSLTLVEALLADAALLLLAGLVLLAARRFAQWKGGLIQGAA
jgi:hypothetical protein